VTEGAHCSISLLKIALLNLPEPEHTRYPVPAVACHAQICM
jgi:hypothetical protein